MKKWLKNYCKRYGSFTIDYSRLRHPIGQWHKCNGKDFNCQIGRPHYIHRWDCAYAHSIWPRRTLVRLIERYIL